MLNVSSTKSILFVFFLYGFAFLPPELRHGWYLHQREISCVRDDDSAHALLFPFTSLVFLLGQFVTESDLSIRRVVLSTSTTLISTNSYLNLKVIDSNTSF